MSDVTSMEQVAGATHRSADVLQFIINEREIGAGCVLVVIAGVDGSSPRAVGSLMGVSDRGVYCGNVSNGCVDADIALQALQVLESGAPRRVRYGVGSPYFDIKLPCGGAIDVILTPVFGTQEIAQARDQLQRRCPISLSIQTDREPFIKMTNGSGENHHDTYYYAPVLHIAVAGNGEEAIALARLAAASDFEVSVYSTERAVTDAAAQLGARVNSLAEGKPPPLIGDLWSAFVCLFHEHALELDLLQGALKTETFYIGAMGSARTHAARLEALRQAGVDEAALKRIRGPIGLIPSTRDAARLAISTLAEIASLYQPRP
ncbi:MAG: XdhC family protein [Pseudomonadota bacterium]